MRLIPTSLTQRTVDPNNPTGGMTIDALMARQKALQEAAPQAPQQIASPWQGAAYLASVFANSQQQKQAAAEETAGRQKLAELMGGINYDTGATPEQVAQISSLDEGTGMKLFADSLSQRRAERQRQQELTDAAANETRTNAEWTRRHELEAEEAKKKATWVTDPADPTKLTNPYSGEVKYIKPTDKWEDDPTTPGAQVNKATGERKYPPHGISIDKDGNIQIGGAGGGKAPPENISKGLEFYTGARNAASNLDNGMDEALRQAGPGAVEWFTGSPAAANYVATPEYRQAKTQGDAFINAVLRRESGAQISEQEYGRAFDLYLPRPGDDDRTLQFKRLNRKVKLQAIKNGIGSDNPTLDLIDEQADTNAAGTGQPQASTPAAQTAAPAATPAPEAAPAGGKIALSPEQVDASYAAAKAALEKKTTKPETVRKILLDAGLDPAKVGL